MNLTHLNPKDKAKVVKINVKNNNAIRIMTLGILESTEVEVLSKTTTSVEVLLHNKSVAVSNDIAKDIMVVRC